MPPHGLAATQTESAKTSPGVMNGARYIDSLRDGREVWLHGEKVKDVTRHPAFANVVRTIADLYDLQCQPATQDTMTYLDGEGVRASVSYLPPTSPGGTAASAKEHGTMD